MAENMKKISKKLVINLIRSLNIVDARLFKTQLSKPDIYVLNKFEDMDYFNLILENDEYVIFKRKDDFFLQYVESNTEVNLIRCYNSTSYFVIDKKNTEIFLILQDIRKIVVNKFNNNILVKNDFLINKINNTIHELYYSYLKHKSQKTTELIT